MKTVVACLLGALAIVPSRSASAHLAGVSSGEYTPAGSSVHAVVTIRADEVALAAATPAVFAASIAVSADGDACTPRFDGADPEAPDGLRIQADYACPHVPSHLRMHFGFLDRLPAGHRHLATVHLPGHDIDELMVLAKPDLELDLGGAPARWGSTVALVAAVFAMMGVTVVALRRRARSQPRGDAGGSSRRAARVRS